MHPAEAAAEYWATVEEVEAAKPALSRHEKACKVLKGHIEPGSTYQGIHLVQSPAGKRLNQTDAAAALGDKLTPFYEDTVRRSLVPVKRPKKYALTA